MKECIATRYGFVCCSLLTLCAPLSAAAPNGFVDSNAERVERFLKDNFAEGKAGMAIGLVDQNGSRVFSAGKLDNGTDQEVNGDTIFDLGSVTPNGRACRNKSAAGTR